MILTDGEAERLFRSSSGHHRGTRGYEERRREQRGDSAGELPLFLFRGTGRTVDGWPEWWSNEKEQIGAEEA
jgi:hypothetical protein